MDKLSTILRAAHLPGIDDFLAAVEWLRERAAYGEHPCPRAPGDVLAWALDELVIQVEQAQDHAEEAPDRLPFAADLAFLAGALLQGGAVPAPLPWQRQDREVSDA